MNILQIGTTDKRGGAAAVSWRIKEAAEKFGWQTSMYVADKHSDEANVFVIPRKKIRRYLGFLLSVEDLYDTDWIMETEQLKNADIVHCHNLHGRFFNLNTLRKMSRIKPVVWTLHDEWAITPHCAYTYETSIIENGFYQCSSKEIPPRLLWHNEKYLQWRKRSLYDKSALNIVAPSLWLKKRLEKSVLGKHPIKLIYNGIDSQIFCRTEKESSRRELGLPLEKKIILFLADAGPANPFKGWQFVERMIDLYRQREDVVFLCVGHHPGAQIEKRPNLFFIEHIDSQNVLARYYSSADLLLHSSTADNFPLVILEAMSCGLPIVGFAVGGVPEAVKHRENGYIAKYGDFDDLACGVDYILNLDPAVRLGMSEANVQKVKENYTLNKMINAYLSLYQKIIKQNHE